MLARYARRNVSSHASPFCAQRAQPAFASPVTQSLARARSRTLVPGRSLTRPTPRHQSATRLVSMRVARLLLATARALGRVTRFECRGCNSPVLVGLQFWRAVRDGSNGASRPCFLLREHGSATSPASLRWSEIAPRVLRLVPATSPVAVGDGAHATSARMRRQTVLLLHCGSLWLRCSCLRVWASALPLCAAHRLSWRMGRDSELSVRCTPLRCAAVRDQPC
jgi:hypothetical protein